MEAGKGLFASPRRGAVRSCAAGLWALLLAAAPAHADYQRAFNAYQQGRFDEARREFLELAALGDHASQMNLAAMARKGEAGPADTGAAVGWVIAAVQNGSTRFDAKQAAQIREGLGAEEKAAADAIVGRYGRAALERTVLPPPGDESQCESESGRFAHFAAPEYPPDARRAGDGVVLLEYTVGADGLARDVAVLQARPALFARTAVAALYDSRFVPAQRDGQPVDARVRMNYTFALERGGALWNTAVFAELKRAADAGLPAAQYVVGSIAALDPTVGVSRKQGQQLVLDAAKGGHPAAQADIGLRFLRLAGCSDPVKARAWLEPAAREGEPVAAAALVGLTVQGGGDLPVPQLRAWLATAANSNDEYALKHVIPWLAGLGPPELADPALALVAAERLDEHGLGVDPQALEARAVASAVNGNFRAAARLQKEAVVAARKLSWNVTAMEERLAEYSAGRAWRGDLYALPVQGSVAPPRTSETARYCSPLTPLDCPAGRQRPDAPPAR